MNHLYIIIFLLIMIIFTTIMLHLQITYVKEAFESPNLTCWDWVMTKAPQSVREYVNNMDPSNSNTEQVYDLLKTMNSKVYAIDGSGNVLVSGSPCILSTAGRTYNSVQNVSCQNIGFLHEENNNCIHHIETPEDIESFKIIASNIYVIRHKADIERKEALEKEKQIQEALLAMEVENNVREQVQNAEAVQRNSAVVTTYNTLQTEHTRLLNELSSLGNIGVLQDTIERTQSNIDTLTSFGNALHSAK